MSDLVLFFDGLCAFVENSGKKEASVLLVNAKNPPIGPTPSVPKHDARLYYQASDFVSASENEDAKRKGTCRFWDLDCEDLSVQLCDAMGNCVDLATNALVITKGPVSGTLPQDQEASHFDWIPKMADVHPGFEEVSSDVLGNAPSCPKVIARMRMTTGTLHTHGFAEEHFQTPRDVHSYAFKDESGNGTYERALTESASLTIPITHHVKLIARKYDGSEERHVVLKPSASGEIAVTIRNEPRSGGNPSWRNTNTFGMVYELSAATANWGERRLPRVNKSNHRSHVGPDKKPKDCVQEGPKLLSVRHAELCPFVQFAAHSDA